MICLIFTHITEIIIFAVGYQLILLEPGFGTISGVESPTFVDYIYYSSVVYTTLGFGDLIPQGLVRIFTSIESLTGLSLVAWSTSAAFIEIQEMNRKKSTLK